jgi:hypothetical protein
MAPKHHSTPLSGGDRKALNKELGKARAMSIALLRNEMPVPKPVRLLGVSLSSLQGDDQEESQLGLPI